MHMHMPIGGVCLLLLLLLLFFDLGYTFLPSPRFILESQYHRDENDFVGPNTSTGSIQTNLFSV